MRRKFIFSVLQFLIVSVCFSQTIHLEFPYFKGYAYDFNIFQGEKAITLKSDTIKSDGKVVLEIPKEYKDYKGMATWYLTNSKTGGGLDLIINNEDFSVSCLDSVPSDASIVYKNCKEQDFNRSSYLEQSALFQKHDAMLATLRAYPKTDALYPIFEREYNALVLQSMDYNKRLWSSPLYVAKFRQIVNLTLGIGTRFALDEKERADNINSFIVNDLDFAVLYTSNHWGNVIGSWIQLQTQVVKDDALLVRDAKTILHRLPTNTIYTDFVSSLTRELIRIGKDDVVVALTSEIKNSKRLLKTDGVLSVYKQGLTGVAPDLVITTHKGNPSDHNHSTTKIKTSELKTKYTLLLFYQSGCGHCEDAIAALTTNYKKLVAKGFRVISLAADTDAAVFSNTSFALPWVDKYCDLEGMKGINFQNYAVIGTPTMYVLDQKGHIELKPLEVQELMNWLVTH